LTGLYPIDTTCATKGSASVLSSAGYDGWGTQSSRTYNGVTATLSYDALNRLVNWQSASGASEQTVYDASGERVLTRATNLGTTTLTVDAFGLQELFYTGTGTLSSQTGYYSLAGHLIGSTSGTTTTYYLTDAQGSLLSSLSASALTGEQLYAPYGPTRYTVGSLSTAKAFTGQEADPLTGLSYDHARWYDPVVGLFLSVDTQEGNAQRVNPYAYVRENPETMTDPTGERVAGCIPGHDGCGSDGTPTPTGEPGGGGHRPNPGGATDLGNCQENPSACTSGPPPKAVPPAAKQPPDKQKKPTCGSVCLSNGHRWLDFIGKIIMLIGGGTALSQVIGDLIKWIGIGISSLLAQGWAQLIDAIFHVARDVLSALDVLGSFLGVLPDSWKSVIRPIEVVLDILTPIADVAGFLLGFFSAPLKALASRIFNNNPIINLMARWGTRAIVMTVVKWSLGQNAAWIEQGVGVYLTGADPSAFCRAISVACESTPPSWVQ
jgi:RHS repeat-associated protein